MKLHEILKCSPLKRNFEESLMLQGTQITELPKGLVVGGFLYCDREKISKYPDNSYYLDKYFEKTNEGYIVYKTFNGYQKAPEYWNIKEGSIIEEPNFDDDRWESCGKGINIATIEWIKENSDITKYPENNIWKCLIRNEWLETVNCPVATAGKIRCRKLELLEELK